MKRRVFVLLTVLVSITRLLPECLPIRASNILQDKSALTCRAKRPFPFDAKPFIKKRLGPPPGEGQFYIFQGSSDQSPDSGSASFFLDVRPLSTLTGIPQSAFLPMRAAGCCTSGIVRNVFHPPSFA